MSWLGTLLDWLGWALLTVALGYGALFTAIWLCALAALPIVLVFALLSPKERARRRLIRQLDAMARHRSAPR